jgi:hypothetical protein
MKIFISNLNNKEFKEYLFIMLKNNIIWTYNLLINFFAFLFG